MRPQIVNILTLMLFLLNSLLAIGQSPSAGAKPPPPPQRTPPEATIDSSIYILLIVAIIYGVYVVYKFKSANKPQ